MSTSDLAHFLDATKDPKRLAALRRTALLDSPPEESFDRLTRLATRMLGVPVALVSLVDEDRQFFKSQCGLPEPWASERETPLSHSFCQHAVNTAAPLIIEDARHHPLVRDNLAIPDLGVIAYAGIPLTTEDGYVLGSFCVIDDKPHRWTDDELAVLRDLAESVTTEITLRTVALASELERREMTALLESTAEGIYGIDEEGSCTFVNPAAAAMLGYTADELLGRNMHRAVHHSHPDGTPYPDEQCPISQCSHHNRRERISGEVFWRKDGSPMPVECTVSPIRDGDVTRGAVVTFVDVTDRLEAEQQLRRSEERFRSVVEATTAIVWYTPPSGAFESEQARWSEFTGQNFEQYRGWGWLDAVHPDDRENTERSWRAAREQRGKLDMEHRLRRHDGDYRHMVVRAVPILTPDGEVREWVGVHTDVTDRRRMEAALADSESRFRLMFQSSPLPMWVFDLETLAFLDVNQAAQRHYGYSREEFLSMAIRDIRPPEEVPQLSAVLTSSNRGLVHRGMFRHRKKDGSIIDVEVTTQEISMQGRPARVAVDMDVTERRRAEEERERLIRALDLERQRLENVFTNAPAVIALYRGPEHTISMVNPAWEQVVGRRNVLGRTFREVFPELQGSGLFELLDQVYRTGEPFVAREMEVHFDRDGDGELEQSYWNFVWQPLMDAAGQVLEIMVHAVEVTDQVLARRRVEELAAERTAILGQLAEGVIVADAQGRIAFVNDAAQRIHGTAQLQVTPEEYATAFHLFTMDGEPYPIEELPLTRAVRGGETVTDALWRIRRPDGTEVIAQGSAAPVRSEDGTQVASVLTLRDVTEQRLLQRQVEVERERLREIFLQAPALIAVLRGPQLVFEIANPPYVALTGGRDLIGKPVREALPELEGQGYFEMLEGVYQSGKPVVGNEMFAQLDRRGDGTLEDGYFNFVFHPLRDADGSVVGILIHAVDVTDQVLARREVERKADELARLARQLEATNRELDQFAYVASHDLKAPLRGIANLSQWIEEDLEAEVSPEVREHLDLLRGRVHRMEGLIDGILQYSRAGRVREKPEPVDTAALLEEVVDLLAPPEHLEVRIEQGMPRLTTERLPLQQVFLNLIGNAAKYNTAPQPWVAVSSADHGDFYEFTIADNGPGIAPEYHERIFGIFQTLEARDKVEGTGIGLSLVKKLVESRGGRIWVESEKGAGAAFRFLWPKSISGELL